jgi:hypothetical protein
MGVSWGFYGYALADWVGQRSPSNRHSREGGNP